MTTLVVTVDRTNDIGRKTGIQTPVAGWEAVRSLVTDVGLADPEDTSVNSLLEALRITRDLQDANEHAVVAVVSGASDSRVSADRSVASQIDQLVEEYNPKSAIVVTDSAEDDRLVPIVESRVRVDSVDRVVVRQARDLESTYYLLKQFLADEELRQTTLVPLGLVLLVTPVLATTVGGAAAAATITAVVGLFFLYKGLSVDEYLSWIASESQEALYSGQVSVVTYVVAVGLALVGVFAGVLGVSDLATQDGVVVPAQFAHASVPWLAMAALAAATGRLLDELIREENIGRPYLHLPFLAVAIGLVIRGFSAHFLQAEGIISALTVPELSMIGIALPALTLDPLQRLALYVVGGLIISVIGVRIVTWIDGDAFEEGEIVDSESSGP